MTIQELTFAMAEARRTLHEMGMLLSELPSIEVFWTRHSISEEGQQWLDSHDTSLDFDEHGESLTIVFGTTELVNEFNSLFPNECWIER